MGKQTVQAKKVHMKELATSTLSCHILDRKTENNYINTIKRFFVA